MGFWYFLLLGIGLFLLVRGMKMTKLRKSQLVCGLCLIAASLFMFQDGSAEIVDRLLNTFSIRL